MRSFKIYKFIFILSILFLLGCSPKFEVSNSNDLPIETIQQIISFKEGREDWEVLLKDYEISPYIDGVIIEQHQIDAMLNLNILYSGSLYPQAEDVNDLCKRYKEWCQKRYYCK